MPPNPHIRGVTQVSGVPTPTTSSHESAMIGIAPHDAGQTRAQLTAFTSALLAEEKHVAGFPGNLAFDLDDYFADHLSVFVNNVGDPTSGDASGVSSKRFERAVIDFFIDLTRGNPHDTYGYVTSGGSEANLHALATARSVLPDAPVYLSAAAHESVAVNADLLRMRSVVVPTLDDDSMDPDALSALTGGGRDGAIVVATIGTTMCGANDDLVALRQAASAAGPVYVHVDAALSGLIAPFAPSLIAWDFGDQADSIAISGH